MPDFPLIKWFSLSRRLVQVKRGQKSATLSLPHPPVHLAAMLSSFAVTACQSAARAAKTKHVNTECDRQSEGLKRTEEGIKFKKCMFFI